MGGINANGKRTAPNPGRVGSYWSCPGVTGGYYGNANSNTTHIGATTSTSTYFPVRPPPPSHSQPVMGRPAAKSVSFAHAPVIAPPSPPIVVPSQSQQNRVASPTTTHGPTSLPLQTSTGIPLRLEGTTVPILNATPTTVEVKGRPRANTSPWLPSLFGGDHQSWFNDPRFDGSFPSRVLPFLYLGNL